MSGQYLNTITENASRLGMRIQETLSEHTRDLAFTRVASSAYLETDDKVKNIRKQLDSSSDREKLDAMRRLVALISKGRNVSEYFAQVVKNVASHNLEIRKLVYIYLLRYAEQEPDLALLSINTFQKDLTDSNPLIRAMALRVLSGIKVPMIGNIVVMAIKKCAADPSPYVRKNAALAIPKCYYLDSSHLPTLIQVIVSLLRDRSPLSIGSVAVAFEEVCPTRLDLLHQHYRRLCRILVDADEWGQIDLMRLLLRYARTMLNRPVYVKSAEELDPDAQLLLTASEPLFQSRNPAVVLGVARVFYYASPPSGLSRVVQPLLRLLTASREVEGVVLAYLLVICREHPTLFTPYYTRFFLRTDDLCQVKLTKIRLLLQILNLENYQTILREFIDYANDTDDKVVSSSVLAIGKCTRLVPECIQQCLAALIAMIKSAHDTLVSNAVLVLKYLVQVQLQPSVTSSTIALGGLHSPLSIISHLAYKIGDIRHAQARACVLWLVGQYATPEKDFGQDSIAKWAPDVLRKTAKTFAKEAPIVKLQIITLAAKLLVLNPTDRTLELLSRYVFLQARYDLNYDVRDRSRMISSLLIGIMSISINGINAEDGETQDQRAGVILRREQVRLVLFQGKAAVVSDEPWKEDEHQMLGSLDTVTGKQMHGDNHLPDWLEEGIESALRDDPEGTPVVPPVAQAISSQQPRPKGLPSPVILTPGASPGGNSALRNGGSKGPWKDLDAFYAEHELLGEGETEEDEDDSDTESSSGEDELEEGETSGEEINDHSTTSNLGGGFQH